MTEYKNSLFLGANVIMKGGRLQITMGEMWSVL